ncbi:MAG: c-type cytochrome [Pseudomonadota bacterium]
MPRLPAAILLTACLPFFATAADVVPYTITNGNRISASLTGQTGDWQLGRRLYFDQSLTGCSTCHGSPGGPGAETVGGTTAPSLAGVGSRLTSGEIRLWIVAPVAIDPLTEMPGFFLPGQTPAADAAIINGPRLTASQIEDIVAYLARQTAAD